MITTDEQPHVREQDDYQWMMFHCPVCNKEVWLDYGDKNDMSAIEPDGYKCCYCQTEVIFEDEYEFLVYMHDDKTDEEWIKSRTYYFDTEKKCPITKEQDEYDPKELERVRQKIHAFGELINKIIKGELTIKQRNQELERIEKEFYDVPNI